MKILRLIASSDPASGGPIEGVRQVSAPLAARGHESELVTLEAPGAPWHAQLGLPVHALGPGRGNYRYTKGLVDWLRRNAPRYDAVVVHGLWQFHGLAAHAALAGGTVPYFVYPHGMLDPWFKRTYPLKHLKKALYWPWAEYRVLRDARAVLFTTEAERLLARESFMRYRACEQVVNYGTAGPEGDPERRAAGFLARHPELQGKRLIGFLGRLHEKKGCDLAIRAFARIAARDSRLQLVLAGPDQTGWQATLMALAQAEGIADRVSWPGMLRGEEKWAALSAFEAFLLPSHQENFGIAVAEALACGTPVLISDQVNIWREIRRDGAGLVAPDTLDGTIELLEGWLALPEAERSAMRERARSCFLARFEIDRAAESLLAVLGAGKEPA